MGRENVTVNAETQTSDADVQILDRDERMELEVLAAQLAEVPPGLVDDPAWLAAARDYSCSLPVRLRETFRRFRHDPGPHGRLRISGLPVRPTGPTPIQAGSVERTATTSATVLAVCMLALGEIVAFHNEKSGALVQNVVPVPGQEHQQGNAGSRPLAMHVENVHHDHRPDYVALLCLRNDHDDRAGLQVASIRDALCLIAPEDRRILAQPRFESTPPASFDGPGEHPIHPVLLGAPDDPDVRVDFVNTRPMDEEAAVAFAALRQALDSVRGQIVLAAGDLAVVDNRVTLHGRSAFVPRYDGNDRWLQRAFVHADHRRSRGSRRGGGNILT
jgi:L-asparagine oxygenase